MEQVENFEEFSDSPVSTSYKLPNDQSLCFAADESYSFGK